MLYKYWLQFVKRKVGPMPIQEGMAWFLNVQSKMILLLLFLIVINIVLEIIY